MTGVCAEESRTLVSQLEEVNKQYGSTLEIRRFVKRKQTAWTKVSTHIYIKSYIKELIKILS